MKNIKFINEEEKNIIESFEKWEWKSDENFSDRKNKIQNIFKNTVAKKKAISIRLLNHDISKLKSKAVEEWIPYQTLISSVIHKYVNSVKSAS